MDRAEWTLGPDWLPLPRLPSCRRSRSDLAPPFRRQPLRPRPPTLARPSQHHALAFSGRCRRRVHFGSLAERDPAHERGALVVAVRTPLAVRSLRHGLTVLRWWREGQGAGKSNYHTTLHRAPDHQRREAAQEDPELRPSRFLVSHRDPLFTERRSTRPPKDRRARRHRGVGRR